MPKSHLSVNIVHFFSGKPFNQSEYFLHEWVTSRRISDWLNLEGDQKVYGLCKIERPALNALT